MPQPSLRPRPPVPSRKLRVLFVCTGNSCRSQMAAGWARHLKAGQILPFAAGLFCTQIDPLAIRVMNEVGVDISGQGQHEVKDFVVQNLDYVVSVCDGARRQCPLFPAKVRVVARAFDDPPALARGMRTLAEKLAVYRRVRDEIRAFVDSLPAALEELGMTQNAGLPVVLFLCTGNSCRSQMAEGFLRAWAADRFDARSAGLEPRDHVHPLAVRAMAEVGINLQGQHPKALKDYLGRLPVRHLIIVCGHADSTCPRIWPGVLTRQFWPLNDPASAAGTEEERLAVFRRCRDEIGTRLRTWLDNPDAPPSGPETQGKAAS